MFLVSAQVENMYIRIFEEKKFPAKVDSRGIFLLRHSFSYSIYCLSAVAALTTHRKKSFASRKGTLHRRKSIFCVQRTSN